MANAPTYLANFQSMVDLFGYWPHFHDSPVLRFKDNGLTIELDVEVWETTDELDDHGFFILRNRHFVGFRFEDLIEKDLKRFMQDNILFELAFSSNEEFLETGKFSVDLDSAMGSDLCGRFSARRGGIAFIRASEDG